MTLTPLPLNHFNLLLVFVKHTQRAPHNSGLVVKYSKIHCGAVSTGNSLRTSPGCTERAELFVLLVHAFHKSQLRRLTNVILRVCDHTAHNEACHAGHCDESFGPVVCGETERDEILCALERAYVIDVDGVLEGLWVSVWDFQYDWARVAQDDSHNVEMAVNLCFDLFCQSFYGSCGRVIARDDLDLDI